MQNDPTIHTLRVGFVGCEKDDIQYPKDLEDTSWNLLEEGFQRVLLRMKVTDVYVGMQRTSELIFARAAIHLKEQGEHLRIHCYLPYRGFSTTFNKQEKALLMECIFKGDETIVVNDGDFRPYFSQVCNEYIVNECQCLLAVGTSETKAIWDSIEYALHAKRVSFVLDPIQLTEGWVKAKLEVTKKRKKDKEFDQTEARLF